MSEVDEAGSLLDRIRRGEPSAVAELYDEHGAAVRAFATKLLGEETAAEDLVHEVFVILPKALRRFRGDSALRSFIIGIAINRAKHHIRKAQRRREKHDRFARCPQPAATDPELEVQRRELAAALGRAIDSLSFDHRVTFVLCEIEEHPSAEVAELLGIPAGTVRTRLFHARRKLRAFLKREGVR